MMIYRGWKDVPELAGLAPGERRKAVRDCFAKVGFGLREFWLGRLVVAGCWAFGVVAGVVLEFGLGFSRVVELACILASILIGELVYGRIYYPAVLEKLRPCFRDYLQSHRVYQADEPNADTTPRRLS